MKFERVARRGVRQSEQQGGTELELVIKTFEQLSVQELHTIMKVRVAVFVVEQRCPYQEIDDTDRTALHLFLQDADGIAAYLRIFMEEGCARIGRVLTTRRGCGLGRQILQAGIQTVKERLQTDIIRIEAQSYALDFYRREGFVPVSEEFLEDGIPHRAMELTL